MQICFNERASILSASSPAGFQLYSVPPSQGYRRLSVVTHLAGASLVAVLDETPLVAMVGSNDAHKDSERQGTDRMLQVYDTSKKEVLSSLFFDSAILNVRMNPKRLVVIRERQTHIFDLNTMAPQSQIATTSPPNSLGLGVLSPLTDGGTCYYCYPFTNRHKLSGGDGGGAGGGDSAGGGGYDEGAHGGGPSERSYASCPGDVVVLEAVNNDTLQPFRAHDHPLVALAMSGDGSRIVTASTSGTIIRVFNLQGLLLHQFRRGQRKARITDLAINYTGTILSVCSDSGTLHLFRCDSHQHHDRFSNLVMRDARSFAKHTLKQGCKNVCAVNVDGTCLSIVSIPLHLGGMGDSGSSSSSAARATLHQYHIEAKELKDIGADYPIGNI